jgi:tRNA uridine 5-carbamoylmethylation protein Kti12
MLTIVCGHYGSGKTNFSINYALDKAKEGKRVILADMDIVNPYFTSSEYSDILTERGVKIISPTFAVTNVDVPSLPASVFSIFGTDDEVVIDAGGDDVGATVLGRFANKVKENEYKMLYVTNMYRPMTSNADDSVEMLRSIEHTCGLKATAVVNNSHLKHLTNVSTIVDSLAYAKEVARIAGIPLLFSVVPRSLMNELPKNEYFYPADVYVGTVWEKGEHRC